MAKPGFELRYVEPEHLAVYKAVFSLLASIFSCQQMQLFNFHFTGLPMTHFALTKVRLVSILEAVSLFNAQKRPFWVKGHILNHSWNVQEEMFVGSVFVLELKHINSERAQKQKNGSFSMHGIEVPNGNSALEKKIFLE